MTINGIDVQAIINTVLGGGITVVTATTIIRTVSQKALNRKFDKLSKSIDLASISAKGIEDAKIIAQESYANAQKLVSDNQKVMSTKFEEVDSKISNLTENVLKDDILNRLDDKLKAVEEYKQTIELQQDTISKYAKDMYDVKVELERLRHKEK